MNEIKAGGIYLLRNGATAVITTVNRESIYTFQVKGYILKVDSLGRTRKNFNIWKSNGRFLAYGESHRDIVIGELK